jgi:hypothetical protein
MAFASETAIRDEHAAAWTVQALRAVWSHQRSRIEARVNVIARTHAALARGELAPELRDEGERAAHMLAGSLGMFGLLTAATAARAIERVLPHAQPTDARKLALRLAELREGLREPVVLPRETDPSVPLTCR